jgi:hypothetical protein
MKQLAKTSGVAIIRSLESLAKAIVSAVKRGGVLDFFTGEEGMRACENGMKERGVSI